MSIDTISATKANYTACSQNPVERSVSGDIVVNFCLSNITNQPPTAIASASPTSTFTGENISFSSTGSYDPDGYIISYLWSFGDNATSSEANPVHAYQEPGDYTVILTVEDDKRARNSTSLIVEVQSLFVEWWKIVPNETMYMLDTYSIEMSVRNPSNRQIEATICSREDGLLVNYSDSNPYGLEQCKTDVIYGQSSAVYVFRNSHYWRWLNPWEPYYSNFIAATLMSYAPGPIGTFASMLGYLQYTSVWLGGIPRNTYTYHFSSPSIANLPQVSVAVEIPQTKWNAYYNSIAAVTVGNVFTFIAPFTDWFAPGLYVAEVISDVLAYEWFDATVDPDQNYTVTVYPEVFYIPEIENLPENSAKYVAKQLLVVYIDTTAFKEAWAKYLGARMAENEEWTQRQLIATSYYTSLIESDTKNLKQGIEILVRDFNEANVTIDENDVIAVREQIAREGLPQIEIDILRRFGFRDSEINTTKDLVLSMPQENAVYLTVNYNKTFTDVIDGYLESLQDIKKQFDQKVQTSFIPAKINIDPDTLNLKSRGEWMTAYIAVKDYDVSKINISTIFLNGIIRAETNPKYKFVKNPEISDRDGDGLPELMVKFNRAEVLKILRGGSVVLTVMGEVNGQPFIGNDTVRVVE